MDKSKKDKLFILIYELVSFLLPTAIALPLALVYQRTVFLESIYIIFGAITFLIALTRSWRRDTKSYKNYKGDKSDIEPEEVKEFRRFQIALYLTGLGLFLLSLISYLLGKYVLGF